MKITKRSQLKIGDILIDKRLLSPEWHQGLIWKVVGIYKRGDYKKYFTGSESFEGFATEGQIIGYSLYSNNPPTHLQAGIYFPISLKEVELLTTTSDIDKHTVIKSLI